MKRRTVVVGAVAAAVVPKAEPAPTKPKPVAKTVNRRPVPVTKKS